ncbi:hypothetical protein HYS92_03030 [Candidatus Daviesbacteria bacterium]|nr:hypothetical protein [Candidatus Daviesbacteria bacterium]
MLKPIQIIPTLFATTEAEYQKRLDQLNASELFQEGWVQLDLMDNKFVPNKSIGLDVIKKNPPPFQKEAQLMVLDPDEWLEGLFELKVDRIILPVEIDKNILDFMNLIQDNNIEVGLSLNPETDSEALNAYLDLLDSVLLMGVKPGFENQQLDLGIYDKIKIIKQEIPSLRVGVDGGVNNTNIKELVNAGVDYLAIGSYLFTGDFDENLERLWETLYE